MNEANAPLRALLLHRLAAAEAAALEDRIVLDDDFAERLELERIDLLDDYAADRLDAEDRAAVEQFLLVTPVERQRAALARALHGLKPAPRPKRWLLPAGAVLVACLVLVVVLPVQRARIVAPSAQPQQAYSLILLAETERGAGERRIAIPADTAVLHLQLEVPQEAAAGGARFGVVIRADGRESFAAADLEAHAAGPYRIVELDIPRAAAGTGRREILLREVGPAPREVFSWRVEFAPP